MTAQITIYLQALGGKFSGPNAYNTDGIELSIQLQQGMPLLISYQLTDAVNDGTISSEYSRRASRSISRRRASPAHKIAEFESRGVEGRVHAAVRCVRSLLLHRYRAEGDEHLRLARRPAVRPLLPAQLHARRRHRPRVLLRPHPLSFSQLTTSGRGA